MKKLAGMVIILGMLAGCVAESHKEHAKMNLSTRDRSAFAYIRSGMSLIEFHNLFPEAYFGGYMNHRAVYLIEYSYAQPISPSNHYRAERINEKLHFYFENGRLMQFDLPSNWEEQTDIKFN